MLRYCIESDRVRIGREESNDIWIDNPAVRPHTLLVYAKDDTHCIKVFDGAKVLLNHVPVTGMHRLYSGDRIGIADREFLYGRDDTPAECSVGLTVLVDGQVTHATVFRRTRVVIGRRECDILLNDAAVADQQLAIECYSHEGLYACDLDSPTGTTLRGVRITDRVRLHDGALLQMGRIGLRVHVLQSDAHGLLLAESLPEQPKVPLAAPAPMDRSPAQRHDPSGQSRRRIADQRPVAGGFIRPLHQANATAGPPPTEHNPSHAHQPGQAPRPPADAVPVTEIGSLQQILQRAHQAKASERHEARDVLVEPEPTQRPRGRGDAERERAVVEDRPNVRVKAAVMGDDPPPLPNRRGAWPDEARESLRVRPREAQLVREMVAVSASPTGFHEQRTNVLDTDSVRSRSSDTAQVRMEAERLFERRQEGAPLTAALDVVSGQELNRRHAAGRAADRPQTWVGRDEPPPVPVEREARGLSRLDKPRLSESELAANPGYYRDRPDQQLHTDGPVRDRKTDASSRQVLGKVIDRSRRVDGDEK